MKILAILGSPHGTKGNTGRLLHALTTAAAAAGAEVNILSLAKLDVRPCQGCNACHKRGECKIKDDFGKVRAALLAADGVVLASPNYIFSVSAQMKAMMDRCCGPLHLQALRGKYGAAVVTSGGPGSDEVERYLLRFLRSMGCWTSGSVGAEARQMVDNNMGGPKLDAAATLGNALVADIRARKTFPEQHAERNAFFERMKQLVTIRREEWPYEYAYWQEHGHL